MSCRRRIARARARGGLAMVAALALVVVLASLAVAFSRVADMNLQVSRSHADLTQARMTVESGMTYALHVLDDCQSPGVVNGIPDVLQAVCDHLDDRMGYPVTMVDDANDPNDLRCVVAGPVSLPDGSAFSFTVYETDTRSTFDDPNDYDPNEVPNQLEMIVTGSAGGLTRRIGMRFNVELNKKILHYAVSSTCRVIARGNIRVHGPVSCSYSRTPHPTNASVRNKNIYPLNIALGDSGYIGGTVGTTMSRDDFVGDDDYGDTDFRYGMDEEYRDNISYDEGETMNLRPEDFDTAPLKAMTDVANLPTADYNGNDWRNWGADPNDTSRPALENVCVPKGTNPIFRNCTFKGVTYIEVDEETTNPSSSNQNHVQFIDCTFEGPIITGVPREMDWNKDKMTFSGNTVFRGSMIQETLGGVTLMAPNFNVNIGADEGGGGEGHSEVVGLLIGGCIDLYNDLTVRGTVVSMARLVNDGQCIMNKNDSWVASSGVCGANIGNISGAGSEIDVYPDPNNVLPLGIKRRYIPHPLRGSYFEVDP